MLTHHCYIPTPTHRPIGTCLPLPSHAVFEEIVGTRDDHSKPVNVDGLGRARKFRAKTMVRPDSCFVVYARIKLFIEASESTISNTFIIKKVSLTLLLSIEMGS